MKYFFIITALLLVSIIEIKAQENEFKPTSSFGIKQGVNYSTVNFSPGIKQSMTLGYTGGLVYKYQNERRVGLQIELNYTQKGWTEDLDTINNSYRRKMDYIELPIITHIVLGKRSVKYYANIGTTFAYLVSETEDLTVNNEVYRREYYEKEIENTFDYGILGEIGITYDSKIGELQIGVRYQLTLTDLFKTSSETVFDNSQNQVWSFAITYFLFDNK